METQYTRVCVCVCVCQAQVKTIQDNTTLNWLAQTHTLYTCKYMQILDNDKMQAWTYTGRHLHKNIIRVLAVLGDTGARELPFPHSLQK